MPSKIIFMTGTDTGVGKTLLTGLLLAHLRQDAVHALALKPFCSGSRKDVHLLQALQDNALLADEINPFYFDDPVAPLVAARLHRRSVLLTKALDHIQTVSQRCDCLLVEGIGGVLVPLGSLAGRGRVDPSSPSKAGETKSTPWSPCAWPGAYTVLDLITNLDCETIVVSRNQLGTLNHTLLTVSALRHKLTCSVPHATSAVPKVALMNSRRPDPSSSSNPRVLTELIAPNRLFLLPFLGHNCHTATAIKANALKFRKVLARLLA